MAKVTHRPFLGGPSSLLPRPIESFLSWSFCISCLSVSGYHYCVAKFVKPLLYRMQRSFFLLGRSNKITYGIGSSGGNGRIGDGGDNDGDKYDQNADAVTTVAAAHMNITNLPFFRCWIPLTTHSRSELDRGTPMDRYHQLVRILTKLGGFTEEQLAVVATSISDDNKHQQQKEQLANLIQLLRESTICRHLASLVMRPYDNCDEEDDPITSASWNQKRFDLPLVNILAYVWPRLLELPTSVRMNDGQNVTHENTADADATHSNVENRYTYEYEISMVIPAYGESGKMLEKQLARSLESCKSPQTVEIIIVDAGGNDVDRHGKENAGLTILAAERGKNKIQAKSEVEAKTPCEHEWGNVNILTYTKGGGRGPCLNYGAAAARGRILTFCHLDTALPTHWDCGISTTIDSRMNGYRANSCAFGFGIDTSPEGLSYGFNTDDSKVYLPPGIRAVETTANIRTQLYSLPYGDQAISVAKDVFDFLGGFPDQCLMEDYELVSLLRKRSALMPKMCHLDDKEELKIISGKPALCSPRRWQKFGVLYVTFMNSKFVNLYSSGLAPDQLYELYYGRSPPPRESELSPWEVTMSEMTDITVDIVI